MSANPSSEHIRPVDQSVLDVLRRDGDRTVQELTERLGVTATAVRQRLERLVDMELVERKKHSVGRGRPLFRYGLTKVGSRFASVSYADLAEALWEEVLALPDASERNRLLHRVAKRLGDGLKSAVPMSGDLRERMTAAAKALSLRKVPTAVNDAHGLPVLEVQACPYPELVEGDEHRQLCEMEQEMLSEAVGQEVQLDCCRLDGETTCQFRPVSNSNEQRVVSEASA